MFKLLLEIGINERINTYPKKEADNLKRKLRSLKTNPFPDGKDRKEIKGTSKSVYRLRTGSYRFFYIIDIKKRIVKVTEFLTAEQEHRKYGIM